MDILKTKLDEADISYVEIDEITIKNHPSMDEIFPFHVTYNACEESFDNFYIFRFGGDYGHDTDDEDLLVDIIKREEPLSGQELIDRSLRD